MYDDKTPKQLQYLKDIKNQLRQRKENGENVTMKYINNIPCLVENSTNFNSNSISSHSQHNNLNVKRPTEQTHKLFITKMLEVCAQN